MPLGVREHDRIRTGTVCFDGLAGEVEFLIGLAVIVLVHVVITGKIVAGSLRNV